MGVSRTVRGGVPTNLPAGDRTRRATSAQAFSGFRCLLATGSGAMADRKTAERRRALPLQPVRSQPRIPGIIRLPGGRDVPASQSASTAYSLNTHTAPSILGSCGGLFVY